jgi:hypothetical protein
MGLRVGSSRRIPVRSLPEVPDLPVVLAARISLSFSPASVGLLFVWFSEGGIGGNFPMFFDAMWPRASNIGIDGSSDVGRWFAEHTVSGYRLTGRQADRDATGL